MSLESLVNERIQKNLALWSLEYRKIRGAPFSFKGHEYLYEIYVDDCPDKTIQKSAQCGISEYFINDSFFSAEKGYNALFIFPADPQLFDFSHGRVKPAIEESEYLSSKVIGIDNVGLKQINRGFIYFRGAQSKKKLRTIDADILFFDELDEMPEGTVALAEKRLGHSKLKYKRFTSTPTVPEMGINARLGLSDKRRWHIKCEHCNEWQSLTFQDNIDLKTVQVICKKCKKPIDRLARGEWVAEYPDRPIHGYCINKLFCQRTSLKELIENSLKTRAFEIQEFYNSDLGEPYVSEGGQLKDDILNACKDNYLMPSSANRCTMGIDIGKDIYVRISKYHNEIKRAVYIGTIKKFEQLDILMRQYDVSTAVIDALPETRKATEFCSRWPGRAYRCYYWGSDTNRNEYFIRDDEDQKVTAHRTIAADYSVNRFKTRTNRLPINIKDIEGYYDHLKAPARIFRKDNKGVEYAVYVEGEKPDHYFHAEIYDELAFNIIKGLISDNQQPQEEIVTAEEVGIERVVIGDY